MKVLVTGATGFVGFHLCQRLLAEGWSVRGTLLAGEPRTSLADGVEPVTVQPLGPRTPWSQIVAGIDTVIHLAARVHVMDDSEADPLTAFRKANVAGTERLAREAAMAGVRRLVFVSSIKVNGKESETPYTEISPVSPTDPYGISKLEAEQALRRIEAETGLQVVVVRPVLVYGPGVKANFLNMMRVVRRGVPLPLDSVRNTRSFLYVGNLADALTTCAKHAAAAGQTYLLSDGEDLSTPELVRKIAWALEVPARLLPLPPAFLRLGGKLFGKSALVGRLTGSLTVDISKIRRELAWNPPYPPACGLRESAKWFLSK